MGLARRSREHLSEREAEEVELPFRNLADPCLVLVHRQLQFSHDLARVVQRRYGVAPPAQDHQVIGIGDGRPRRRLGQDALSRRQARLLSVDRQGCTGKYRWSYPVLKMQDGVPNSLVRSGPLDPPCAREHLASGLYKPFESG